MVLAVLAVFAGRAIQTDEDVLPGGVTGLGNGLHDVLQGRFVVRQVRREAALIADVGVVALLVQDLFERMEHFHTGTQRFAESRQTCGNDHEFLHVEHVVCVRAAVDDVHHRYR